MVCGVYLKGPEEGDTFRTKLRIFGFNSVMDSVVNTQLLLYIGNLYILGLNTYV